MKYIMTYDKTFQKPRGNEPFFIFSRTPPYQPRSQSKIKTTGKGKIGGTLIIPCIFNISHPLTCPKNLGKKTKNKNYLELSILLSLSTLQCRFRSQKKIKSVRHNKIKHTLFILIKYSMICDWTCPKYWGNGSQRLKILKKDHFS